jgi:hypothetical protein
MGSAVATWRGANSPAWSVSAFAEKALHLRVRAASETVSSPGCGTPGIAPAPSRAWPYMAYPLRSGDVLADAEEATGRTAHRGGQWLYEPNEITVYRLAFPASRHGVAG